MKENYPRARETFYLWEEGLPLLKLHYLTCLYTASLFKMHVTVWERLDCIRGSFLWYGKNSRKNLHLLRWSDAIKPIAAGGFRFDKFGIENLDSLSQMAMGVWGIEMLCGER